MKDAPDIEKAVEALPAPTLEGIEAFLASPFVKGIGKVYAAAIVEQFGPSTLEVILESPERLKEVQGLGDSKIASLTQSIEKLKHSPGLIAFLYSSGLSDADVEKILGHYKKLTAKVVAYDPYEMVEDAWKLSFFTADKIGRFMGIAPDDERRLRGALLTAVKIYAEMGNMFAREDQAVALAAKITGVPAERFGGPVEDLVADERLVRSRGGLYLPVYYKAEKGAAQKLTAIVGKGPTTVEGLLIPERDLQGNPLSAEQRRAISTVLANPVTVITGGPGTGKTTAIRGIIEALDHNGGKIILAAPTGRAAKRLSNLTGMEASTLHRLLGYRPGEGYRRKKLDADILVIDESSMLEQVMFNHLLDAIGPDTKIVLVGDVNQLPAIGAGDVLRDLIASETVPVVRLTENFRQRQGSAIVAGAMAVNSGTYPEIAPKGDFDIVYEKSIRQIHQRLLKLVAEEIPALYEVNPMDIQVVTPQQEGPLGAKQLNLDLQQRLNPVGPSLTRGRKTLRVGDRVMQTDNSSARGVYNGETGWVSAVDAHLQTLEVTFHDGKRSVYNVKELGELSLAYAITVHKLQGSETDYMVMPVTLTHGRMLYRNLLYTAISRAKRLCVLVGERKAISMAVENASPMVRNSNFKSRLRDGAIPSDDPSQLTA